MTGEKLVTFELLGGGAIGVARLVREKPLNSLLLETINQLAEQIYSWLDDESIKCIVLDSSSERAFCAGADITALYRSIIESKGGENPYAEAFFLNEYRLDYRLHQAAKPIVVWGNGIVMGGGLGLMGGCSHRIGTPATRIAMPEITIGLFPDAGGTALLSRLPDQLGLFVGLTGCQLSAGDALALDLLDGVVDAEQKTDIFERLAAIEWSGEVAVNHQMISDMLKNLQVEATLPYSLLTHRDTITAVLEKALASEDFFGVFDAELESLRDKELRNKKLQNEKRDGEWLQAAIETYRSGSAVTARIVVEQMRRAVSLTLEEMFQMELAIAYQCIRHADFPEGVRALLIDKDRNPQWSYASAADVPNALVEAHFQPSWSGTHPLQL